jgi:hypothetical protein
VLFQALIGLFVFSFIGIAVAIYKFGLEAWIESFNFPDWKVIDWIIHITGVMVYGLFWCVLALLTARKLIARFKQ